MKYQTQQQISWQYSIQPANVNVKQCTRTHPILDHTPKTIKGTHHKNTKYKNLTHVSSYALDEALLLSLE